MRNEFLRVLIFVAGHIFGATLLTACPEKKDSKVVEVETEPQPSPTITVTPVPVATVSPSGS